MNTPLKSIIIKIPEIPIVFSKKKTEVLGCIPFSKQKFAIKILVDGKIQNHKSFLRKINIDDIEVTSENDKKIFFKLDIAKIKSTFFKKNGFYPKTLKLTFNKQSFNNLKLDVFLNQYSIDKLDDNIKEENLNFKNSSGDLYGKLISNFDKDFYEKISKCKFSDKKSAINHYFNFGRNLGFDPNPDFSSREYQIMYDDVSKSGLNPFEHFIRFGMNEGRFKSFRDRDLNEKKKWEIQKIVFSNIEENIPTYSKLKKINPTLKVLAFYLPQFHPFEENDNWWGKGFTEWTNVTDAKPIYKGHYQPRLPRHFGFYDLRLPEVLKDQFELASEYGIYGFNFYFYWFDGKTLMEQPLEQMLNNKKNKINYCFTWANENWTRRWDGLDDDVLISQNYNLKDSENMFDHLTKYFKDDRYIKINGCPVFCIYRPNLIPHIKKMLSTWRKKSKEIGFPGLYLLAINSFNNQDFLELDFDGAIEFPPHNLKLSSQNDNFKTNKDFNGNIYSYDEAFDQSLQQKYRNDKTFRSVMLNWDNTARKKNNASIFSDFSIQKYSQWLDFACNNVFQNKYILEDEKFVFINAWNEWAEGTYLEPDNKFGYAALTATHNILSNYNDTRWKKFSSLKKTNENALIIHLHYIDTLEEIKERIKICNLKNFDLIVTTTLGNSYDQITSHLPNAQLILVENRGRDILPFLNVLKIIKNFEYKCICKIHGKKTVYRIDGNELRHELLKSILFNKKSVENILKEFSKNSKLGILSPKKFVTRHNSLNMESNKKNVSYLCEKLNIVFENSTFPAGSMFWFNPNCLINLEKIESEYFAFERGFSDGTMAHAVERIFSIVSNINGFDNKYCDDFNLI